jgi:hypothetical protein
MDGVEKDQWCTCEPKVSKAGKEYQPAKKSSIAALFGW